MQNDNRLSVHLNRKQKLKTTFHYMKKIIMATKRCILLATWTRQVNRYTSATRYTVEHRYFNKQCKITHTPLAIITSSLKYGCELGKLINYSNLSRNFQKVLKNFHSQHYKGHPDNPVFAKIHTFLVLYVSNQLKQLSRFLVNCYYTSVVCTTQVLHAYSN